MPSYIRRLERSASEGVRDVLPVTHRIRYARRTCRAGIAPLSAPKRQTLPCNVCSGRSQLKFIAIALGGSFGALARYYLASFIINRVGNRFPYGTLVVNMTACVLIGFVLAYLNRREDLSPLWRFFVPVGFIGAYSTFSTFIWETLSSMEAGAFLVAAANLVVSVVLGLAAVWGGAFLARFVR